MAAAVFAATVMRHKVHRERRKSARSSIIRILQSVGSHKKRSVPQRCLLSEMKAIATENS